MILHEILDQDLHRQKSGIGVQAFPLMIEIPATKEFVPCVISTTRGKFIHSSKLTSDQKIRVGLFNFDENNEEDLINDMFVSAYSLSKSNEWENIFYNSTALKLGFDYIRHNSGLRDQPHVCLIPKDWSNADLLNRFKSQLIEKEIRGEQVHIYRKICKLIRCKIPFPVYLSKPDYVGIYTRFLGINSGILLHNIRRGIAFCPQ